MSVKHIKEEKTLVSVKPDGVKRGLIGEIIRRVEQRGLKIVAMKMILPSREMALKHLPASEEWMMRLGDKGLTTFAEYELDPLEFMGTNDKKEIGGKVKDGLVDYLTSGPVVAMVIQGIHAINMVRKIAGHTLPMKAEMGTVRGDYSVDSPIIANVENRAIHNIMHASETPAEADNEINLWFNKNEIHEYKRAEEDLMF